MKKVRVKSIRVQLQELMKLHPGWTYKQFAEALDTSPDVVRSYASRYRMLNMYRPIKTKKSKQPQEHQPKPEKRQLKSDHVPKVSSSATRSRSVGYLKLM